MEMKDRFRGYLPVVLDLETGGVDPFSHAILEIAIVFLDWRNDLLHPDITRRWAVQPHPDTNIEDASLELVSIDPYDPERGAQLEETCLRECFRSIRNKLEASSCSRAYLVGHNAYFDHSFVRTAAQRNGVGQNPFHLFTVIDTASLAAVSYGHSVLSVACSRAGIDFDENKAHSALYDATVTAQLFCTIVNECRFNPEWLNLTTNDKNFLEM